MTLKFLGSQSNDANRPKTVTLFKVYCYRGKPSAKQKQVWYETECNKTGDGISWSPQKKLAIQKAEKLGYIIINKDNIVLKFYKSFKE